MRVPAALARAELPPAIVKVLRTLGDAGHRSWIVGGAVRDLLLHRPREANDFDVATPATPRQVTALFRKVVPTGAEHGTVTVVESGHAIEVTTFRGEGAYRDGRRPEAVTFHTDLEADLARRDFTMNALAWDPLAPEFRDPFDGRADMARRIVRAVGEPADRFGEDGLRAMRAVRFAAQLGYGLHGRTRAAIPRALDVVRKVSVERVSDELTRLVAAPHAEKGIALMRSTGLLETVLPALAALPRRTLDHAVAVLRRVPPDPVLRFAALFHPLPPDEVERILVALRQPRRLCEAVAHLLRAHACRAATSRAALPASRTEVRRWLSRVGLDRAEGVLALAEAEARSLPAARARRARTEVGALRKSFAELRKSPPPLSTQDLALDGRAVMAILGAGPGPHVGEALRHLLDRVLEDPSLNDRGPLERELQTWWAGRPPTA
ncbi:MAG TPA: CCA tRNA nucleotidyltransferase [Anaeromyxobacter sp.]